MRMLDEECDIDIDRELHETVEAEKFNKIRAVVKLTMRDFDEAWLTPVRVFSPEDIRLLRERECVSQPIFALYMNVSRGVVSAWECGSKKPGGAALRLLTIIKKYGIQAIR